MISRISGAAARAVLMAAAVAAPALILPGSMTESGNMTALAAILAGCLVFMEYNATYPSILEFRDAAPMNRLRFAAMAGMLVAMSLIVTDATHATAVTSTVTQFSYLIGSALDFPFSPVRLILLMMPPGTPEAEVTMIRAMAGASYFISLLAVAIFFAQVRLRGWPVRQGAFNVWINLPLFDPTAGGDVVARLQRDASINICVGFLLPFVIPAVVKVSAQLAGPVTLAAPQTMIWMLTAWAFLPAGLIIRGIALGRVAEMIEAKRRRAYAHGEGLQTV